MEIFLLLKRNLNSVTASHGKKEREFIAWLGAGVAVSHHIIARIEEMWQSRIRDYLFLKE